MPEWGISDFGIAGLIVGGVVYVVVTYIKTAKVGVNTDDRRVAPHMCANSMIPYITDSIKTNTELVTVIREQQQMFKQNSDKQQEALQGMIIAINNLVSLSKETLERVKDIERK